MSVRSSALRRTDPHAVRIGLLAPALMLASCVGARAPPVEVAQGQRVAAFNRPYQVRGRWYSPHVQPGYDQVGVASWYSYEAPGRRTADGELFDIRLASAAHTTLPIPSWLEVTNLDNGRRARVRLNDRGPFVSGRLLDVSRGAAEELGFVRQGTARVRVRYLGPAAPLGGPSIWAAAASAPTETRPISAVRPASYVQVLAAASPDLPTEVSQERATAPVVSDVAEAGAPSTPTAPASSVSDSATDDRFEVQVAAFANRSNAERAAARMSAAGRPRIEPLRRGDTVLYRVLIGAWAQAEGAAEAQGRAVAMGFVDARVVAR